MVSDGSVLAIALLLFSTFTQGHFGVLDRSYSVSRTVGQRVDLPCVMEQQHRHSVTQIEWKKMEGRREHKIAIYNPNFKPTHYYWTNVSVVLDTPGGVLRGSFLKLPELDEWDGGVYVCELTTFPAGTVKIETHLSVIAVQVSAAVLWPIGAVREGDAVTVVCNSSPPAESYSLWPSKNKSSILKTKDGRFTLPNVTREDSDLYVCQPENSSFGLTFEGYSATVNVTVNYFGDLSSSVAPPISTTATNEKSHDVTPRSTAVSKATGGNTTSSFSSLPTGAANSAAPEQNDTSRPASTVNATQTPLEFNGTENGRAWSRGQPTTTPSHGARITATIHFSNNSRNVTEGDKNRKEPTGSVLYILVIVLPVFLLLVVILLLYRRHMERRKKDLPPPFKPPPPPVKYTSIRTQDTSVTVQQPWGNGTH